MEARLAKATNKDFFKVFTAKTVHEMAIEAVDRKSIKYHSRMLSFSLCILALKPFIVFNSCFKSFLVYSWHDRTDYCDLVKMSTGPKFTGSSRNTKVFLVPRKH